MGKIREELNTGRLWYKRPSHDSEILIMDMTLALGDTFEIDAGHWVMVDSVFYLDNRKVIRFDMDSGWDEKIMFIEGVGPNISIIYHYDGYSTFYASCKYQDNELIYVNENNTYFEGCQPSTVGINNLVLEPDIKISPNPARDELNISLPDNFQDCQTISIFDLSGRLHLQEVHCGNEFRLDVKALQPGFYLLRIMNPIGIIDQKFLKH
jgi:hypothetical protein